MSSTSSSGAGTDDPQVDGAGAVQDRLARRTQQILDRSPAPADPVAAEREKLIVRECRYLMRLLTIRRRSAGEMRGRLAQREVPAGIIHEVMARMDRAELIDDETFAREWIRQRRELRALSDRALRRELEQRRVDAEVIEAALERTGGDEEQRCRELVRSRIDDADRARLRTERDGSHRRRLARRLDALLTRKGYPGGLAIRIISAELHGAGAQS